MMGLACYFALMCVAFAAQSPVEAPAVDEIQEWIPRSRLRVLHRIGTDLAKLGREEEVTTLAEVLRRLGETQEGLARFQANLAKHLEGEPGSLRHSSALITRLEKETERLSKSLAKMPQALRTQVAETLLLLDAQNASANMSLWHVRSPDGQWARPNLLALDEGRRRLSLRVQEARALAFGIDLKPSSLTAVRNLYGEGRSVSAHGITLHGAQSEQKLRRILHGVLQGLALSEAMRGKPLAVPDLSREHEFLLLDSRSRFESALTEAVENLGLSFSDVAEIESTNQLSFQDKRGWRTSTWRPEAAYQSFLLWMILREILGDGTQPCLAAGHMNWITLALYGTTLPNVMWLDPHANQRTLTKGLRLDGRAVWRSAQRGLYGCRSWMIERVRRNEDPPWWKAMVDQLGKIQNDVLFKTTLVHEYLACSNQLASLLEATRAEDERVRAFEAALETDLPTFEERWGQWLLGSRDGLVQRLTLLSQTEGSASEGQATKNMVRALNKVRAMAFRNQPVEFEQVVETPELNAGARAHARYLRQNEEQKYLWPDAHEEYIDRPGFTPEGARAGLNSVIAFTGSPDSAMRQWMGTFYHRLPLLDPSVFAIGFASVERIDVLDCRSLRAPLERDHWIPWPADRLTRVPRKFQPEFPNPVPGSSQESLGYPITLQVFRAQGRDALEIRMSLEIENKKPVECHFLSPDQALFEELVPPNAWCLIPKEHLKAATGYVVKVQSQTHSFSWSFRTER